MSSFDQADSRKGANKTSEASVNRNSQQNSESAAIESRAFRQKSRTKDINEATLRAVTEYVPTISHDLLEFLSL